VVRPGFNPQTKTISFEDVTGGRIITISPFQGELQSKPDTTTFFPLLNQTAAQVAMGLQKGTIEIGNEKVNVLYRVTQSGPQIEKFYNAFGQTTSTYTHIEPGGKVYEISLNQFGNPYVKSAYQPINVSSISNNLTVSGDVGVVKEGENTYLTYNRQPTTSIPATYTYQGIPIQGNITIDNNQLKFTPTPSTYSLTPTQAQTLLGTNEQISNPTLVVTKEGTIEIHYEKIQQTQTTQTQSETTQPSQSYALSFLKPNQPTYLTKYATPSNLPLSTTLNTTTQIIQIETIQPPQSYKIVKEVTAPQGYQAYQITELVKGTNTVLSTTYIAFPKDIIGELQKSVYLDEKGLMGDLKKFAYSQYAFWTTTAKAIYNPSNIQEFALGLGTVATMALVAPITEFMGSATIGSAISSTLSYIPSSLLMQQKPTMEGVVISAAGGFMVGSVFDILHTTFTKTPYSAEVKYYAKMETPQTSENLIYEKGQVLSETTIYSQSEFGKFFHLPPSTKTITQTYPIQAVYNPSSDVGLVVQPQYTFTTQHTFIEGEGITSMGFEYSINNLAFYRGIGETTATFSFPKFGYSLGEMQGKGYLGVFVSEGQKISGGVFISKQTTFESNPTVYSFGIVKVGEMPTIVRGLAVYPGGGEGISSGGLGSAITTQIFSPLSKTIESQFTTSTQTT
ncbi:MAG: hypothetical protein ACP5HJ_03605, partial [Candidatus Micrarchaeia archaeon]